MHQVMQAFLWGDMPSPMRVVPPFLGGVLMTQPLIVQNLLKTLCVLTPMKQSLTSLKLHYGDQLEDVDARKLIILNNQIKKEHATSIGHCHEHQGRVFEFSVSTSMDSYCRKPNSPSINLHGYQTATCKNGEE